MPQPAQSKCVPFLSPDETLAQYASRTGIKDFGKMTLRVPTGIAVRRSSQAQTFATGGYQVSPSQVDGAPPQPEAPVELLTHDLNTVSIEEAARAAVDATQQFYEEPGGALVHSKVLIGGNPVGKNKHAVFGVKSWLSVPIGRVAMFAAFLDMERRGDPVYEVMKLSRTASILACALPARPALSWYARAGMTPRAGMPGAGLGDVGDEEPTVGVGAMNTLGAINDSPSDYNNYPATDSRRWLYACEGIKGTIEGTMPCAKPGAVGSISLFKFEDGSVGGIYITAGLSQAQINAYFDKAGATSFPQHYFVYSGQNYKLMGVPAWVAQACAKTYGIPTNFKQENVETNTQIQTGMSPCPPHSHRNASNTACECDAGYAKSPAGECLQVVQDLTDYAPPSVKVACPRGWVRNAQGKCVKLPGTAAATPVRSNPFGTTKRPPKIGVSGVGDPRSLPAHLRDPNYRPLKPMAITPAAAMKHNIAKNFDGLGNVRPPATLSCQQGFALYQGKCIPKSRVPGGSLAGPAPAGTTRELIDRIAAQVASQAAAKPAIYVVARNEGTSTVANKLRVSVDALLAANPTKPTIRLASGQRVFAQLTVGEKLNVPTRASTVTTVTGGGTLGAGPGEPCDSFDWCGSGYSCVDGICVADFVPAQAGMSNEGSYCDAGGGPQSGYINGGVCVPLGSSGGGDGTGTSQSVTGDILCPGPNMQISILKMACVCEDGFVPDPNGPGCVPEGTAGTYAQASLLCTMTGGTGTNDACSCPSGFTWDYNNGCIDSKGKPGGLVAQTAQGGTGGTAGGKPGGGGAKPGSGEPPVDAKGSLMGSLPSTPWLVGGALAIAAVVGGGAYAVTRSKKKGAKGKDKKADKAAKKAAKAAKEGSK